MMKIVFVIFGALFLSQVKCKDSKTYKAAVVEYFPKKINGSLFDIINGRVDEYVDILSKIKAKLDIIVYPEATLLDEDTTANLIEVATTVKVEDVPCGNKKNHMKYFVKLSCAAKKYRTYLSVNILEKSKCEGENCPNDWLLYNTNVVFDRSGKIVATYRKLNLFGEDQITVPEPMRTTFTSDFGVTFGMFICFDILFKEPALEVVGQGVKHFIYPTMWFPELPFLTADQTQYMWSYENDVVLLASGANIPKAGCTGSGIYQGRKGPLTMYMSGKEGSKVLIADVEKVWDNSEKHEIADVSKSEDVDDIYFTYDKLNNNNTYNLDLRQREYKYKISDDFECIFKVEAKNTDTDCNRKSYRYKLVAYSDLRNFVGSTNEHVQICSIVACTNDSIQSCGRRILKNEDNYPIKFDKIEIEMKVKENENSKQFPNAVYSNLMPLGSKHVDWKENGRSKVISLKTPGEPFFVFGILGRVF